MAHPLRIGFRFRWINSEGKEDSSKIYMDTEIDRKKFNKAYKSRKKFEKMCVEHLFTPSWDSIFDYPFEVIRTKENMEETLRRPHGCEDPYRMDFDEEILPNGRFNPAAVYKLGASTKVIEITLY